MTHYTSRCAQNATPSCGDVPAQTPVAVCPFHLACVEGTGLIGPILRRVLVRRRQLPQGMVSRNLKAMEVHFTPEQEAQFSEIATKAGTDPERLVKDATLRLLEEDVRFRAAVREGIEQADRGEFIEEAEMDARLEQMLRS